MTMQAVKNLLQKAKSNLQTIYQEKGRLISAAVKQIADQVDNLLNQQEGDQRVQEPANQKRDLKEVIESKLKQSLEKLQQSLKGAPLLLDDTRLENDLTGYIKELEKDFQSKLAQMQEREKRLQENNEQFEKMREEEKDIYSGTFLNEPPEDARAKYWNTIQDVLFNSIRASEGYRFYDHTAILRYAEAEKQEKIEDIIRSIKNRYLIEKEEVIVPIDDNNHEKCIISKTIGDLVRDSIKEDYKQAKPEWIKHTITIRGCIERRKEADRKRKEEETDKPKPPEEGQNVHAFCGATQLSIRRNRCPMGNPGTLDPSSQARWTSARNCPARNRQRDFLCATQRVSVANASSRFSQLVDDLSLFPAMEAGWNMGACASCAAS